MFIPLDVTYDIRYSFPSYLTNIKRVGVDNRYRTGWGGDNRYLTSSCFRLVRYEWKLYLISQVESNGMNMITHMAKGGGTITRFACYFQYKPLLLCLTSNL